MGGRKEGGRDRARDQEGDSGESGGKGREREGGRQEVRRRR